MKTSGWARYAIAMVVGMGMIHLEPAHAIPLVNSDSCCIASQAGNLTQNTHYRRHYHYYGYPSYRYRNYYSYNDDYYYRPYYQEYYSYSDDYYYRPYRRHYNYYRNYYRYPYYGHHRHHGYYGYQRW